MIVIDGVEMLDVREAARLAGRTPETIRRWVWAGRIGAHRRGNRLLVSRESVAALAAPGSGSGRAQSTVTLEEWRRLVVGQRRSHTLDAIEPSASAADLVLADRHSRDDVAD